MKTAASLIAFLTFFLLTPKSYSQQVKSYDYLLKCYKNAEKEKGDIEIEGIGEVNSTALIPEGIQSSGLTYFTLPKASQKLKSSKIAKLVTEYQISTWKNNSKIISNRQYHDGKISVNDLRLHLNMEDTNMQVIIISDGDIVYQLISFQGDDKKDNFDDLLVKIRQYQCP